MKNNLLFLVSLQKICRDYYKRISELEDAKYDLEYSVAIKDLEASTHTHTLHFQVFCLQNFLISRKCRCFDVVLLFYYYVRISMD